MTDCTSCSFVNICWHHCSSYLVVLQLTLVRCNTVFRAVLAVIWFMNNDCRAYWADLLGKLLLSCTPYKLYFCITMTWQLNYEILLLSNYSALLRNDNIWFLWFYFISLEPNHSATCSLWDFTWSVLICQYHVHWICVPPGANESSQFAITNNHPNKLIYKHYAAINSWRRIALHLYTWFPPFVILQKGFSLHVDIYLYN